MDHDEWITRQQSVTVTVDDHELDVAYLDEGSGRPIVCCHGIPTSSYLWRYVTAALQDQYRVIVPDMIGYGNSAIRDGFDRSIRAQEQMIDGLLETLNIESTAFVGHDLGGGVGLRYAVHQPDAISQLVCSNAVCYDSWPIERIVELGLPDTIANMSVDELQDMLRSIFRDTLADDEPDEEFVDAMVSQWDSDDAVISLSRNAIGTNTAHTTEIDPRVVEAETLILWGAEDEFQEISYGERLADDIPNAELIGMDGANHWVPEDRPDAYAEHLIDFLAA